MMKVHMTLAGKVNLEEELRRLIKERGETAELIEEARMHGDLSENAEYHAAKEKQGFIFGRIAEIEGKLSRAMVIDPKKLKGNRVVFGCTVTVFNCTAEKEETFQIVGEDEADFKQKKLSINSPVVRALIGKEVDDVAYFETPEGDKEFEVLKIIFI